MSDELSCGDEPFWTPNEMRRAMESYSGTVTLPLTSEVRDVFQVGRMSELVPMSAVFEQTYTVPKYRHDRVWKYRRERKGARKTDTPKVTMTRRTVLPNVVVTRGGSGFVVRG